MSFDIKRFQLLHYFILGNSTQVFVFSLSLASALFLSFLIHDEKTKQNQKPILISPDPARAIWEVWLSSSPPRRVLSRLLAFVPWTDPPLPLVPALASPTVAERRGGSASGSDGRVKAEQRTEEILEPSEWSASFDPYLSSRLRPGASQGAVSEKGGEGKGERRGWGIRHPREWKEGHLYWGLRRDCLAPLPDGSKPTQG